MSDQRPTGDATDTETARLRAQLAAAEAAVRDRDRRRAEPAAAWPPSGGAPKPNPGTLPAGAEPPAQPPRAATGYGYGSNVLGDGDVHLRDYVKVVYKRRWTAITVFLVVFLSVAIYTFTATPIFESKVQILIEKEASNVVSFKEAIEQNQVTDDYYQTQYKILHSRALARRTIDAAKLWDHPQFNPKRDPLTAGRIVGAPVALVSGWFKAAAPAAAPGADETKIQSRTIDRFLGSLTISPIRNSRLVDVTFASPTAELSSQVANTLAKAYIEQNLEYKFTASKDASDWLGARLVHPRNRLALLQQRLTSLSQRMHLAQATRLRQARSQLQTMTAGLLQHSPLPRLRARHPGPSVPSVP